jgi:maltose alpha-D-glucosyltransferase/alpha-amylase
MGSKSLALLEREVLPAFLPKQRWFSDKDKTFASAPIIDTVRIGDDDTTASLTIVEAGSRYFVPLAIGPETVKRSAALERATMARTRSGATSGFLYDGFADDAFVLALLEAVRGERRLLSTRGGTFAGTQTEALREIEFSSKPKVRRMDVEQSNTSVVIAERVVLKGYRKVHPGPQPELETARFLDRVGYRNTPALCGYLQHIDAQGEETALCILQAFVESQGDGWSTTLAYLDRFFDRQRSLQSGDGSVAATPVAQNGQARENLGVGIDDHELFLARMRRLGIRTAEMHRAFATPTGNPAFEPEPVTQDDIAAWSARARESAAKALATLEREIDRIPLDVQDFARSLPARRAEIMSHLEISADFSYATLVKTRFHGDFHLGQVLTVADDYMIVDFEGEPGRPLAERRRKSSPLLDVAGMLRSLNYATVAGMRGVNADRAEDTRALEPFALAWERRSVDAFLSGYRETIAGTPSYPADPQQAQHLLELFMLEKAFYEMSYELANRPSWVRIPLEGIRSVLEARGATAYAAT